MNIIMTFDYEIFFGKDHGSVDECLINPTNLLDDIAKEYKVKFTFFMDIGYLIKLKEYSKKYNNLKNDLDNIYKQIKDLIKKGHSIQLHIHSHWEGSYFDGENWNIDYTHYKLQSLTDNDISEIVRKYKYELEAITEHDVFVFRAGGWCIQPFDKIRNHLYENRILIDSSVIPNSISDDYNFKNSPAKSFWNFDVEPNIEKKGGAFLEIPISSIKISPIFYWKLLFSKIFQINKNKTLGDGNPINPSPKNILQWLLLGNYTVVSADGLKSNLLIKAVQEYEKKSSMESVFTIIGHPKSLTKNSIDNIRKFVDFAKVNHKFITYDLYKGKIIN